MAADSALYGIPRSKTSKTKEISSSSTLAFTTQLSTLLAQSKPTSTSSTARSRPSKSSSSSKPDIFTTHNKNTKKRAAADDISNDNDSSPSQQQVHQSDIGAVDSTTLHRSKRKMEEKARLYAAMKRGDYVPPTNPSSSSFSSTRRNDHQQNSLVDFDRKWAESAAAAGDQPTTYDTSSDSGGGGNSSDEEEAVVVEYEDEFGRQRQGTRAEASREQRRRQAQTLAAQEAVEFSARPAAPSTIIFGDTVQSGAFNPETGIARAMEELAGKRDRSATPPAETHYDASKEVRSKGVGFYAFSGDGEGRRREMEELGRERERTEGERKGREERVEKRRREVEERRRVIREKKGERLAERFLEGLGGELAG